MTRISSLGTTMLLFALTLLAGVFALTMLGSASIAQPTVNATIRQAATIEWLQPDQVHIPNNLVVNAHAVEHNGEAEKLYWLIKQGQCVMAAKFCGGSEIEKMYVCVDPITGLVGAILQFGDEVTTGYFERGGSGYWSKRIAREDWEACR